MVKARLPNVFVAGVERIEYSNYDDFDEQGGLFPQLVRYFVKGHTHPRTIWEDLESDPTRGEKYYLALSHASPFPRQQAPYRRPTDCACPRHPPSEVGYEGTRATPLRHGASGERHPQGGHDAA